VTENAAQDAADAPPPPAAERTISDVETLKALSDPVRLRILETMVQAADEDWTVKRLAAALEVGPTKLYHHIGVLEAHEFIRPSGQRLVSGIIETRYRIAQLTVKLDRNLLSGGDPDATASAVEQMLDSLFTTAREDVARAIRTGAMTLGSSDASSRGMIQQGIVRVSDARARELKERLNALLTEFDGADPGGSAFGILIAMYPVVEAGKEPSDA
jgi:DNA-binding transcriptional ArsR family regulator